MSFLFPEFLWAFLVLLIPIIIHLFNFKKYKTLYFSSLNFIKHVDQKTRSTQQLKHILVLLSRVLAFSFLVLAFAQPFFDDGVGSKNSKNTIVCIYIDNSFSMQARGAEGELISEARQKAQEIIEKSSLDTKFVIGTNAMSGREQHILNKVDALEKIDGITFSPLPKPINQIVNWQSEVLSDVSEELGSDVTINYFLFSDFQKNNANKNINETAIIDINYYPVQLIPEKFSNVYIDSIWFTSPVHKVNAKNELNIKAVNTGKEDLKNVEISIAIANYNKTIFIDLPAESNITSVVTYTNKTEGFQSGSIKIVDKHVFFDDSYYISYEVKKNTNVLVLNGEDAVSNTSMVYDLDDYYVTKTKEITAITKDDFSNADIVIINGVNDLSSGVVNYLIEFIENGGSVSLFPGRKPNLNEWNNFLSKVKLAGMGSIVPSGNRINSLNYADPFFTGMFERETNNLNMPSVSKTFRALASNSGAISLIQLQNGLPLLTYNKLEGNVFMFYSSIHSDFGNFSKDALFSAILLRMGEMSSRKQPLSITIGKDTRFPIYSEIPQSSSVHIKDGKIDFIPQISEIGGVHYISINQIDDFSELLATNYTIETEEIVGKLSLNYNRLESNLTPYSIEEITGIFGNTGKVSINQVGSGDNLSALEIDKPFSYWRICIILALIFIFVEMLLVRLLK